MRLANFYRLIRKYPLRRHPEPISEHCFYEFHRMLDEAHWILGENLGKFSSNEVLFPGKQLFLEHNDFRFLSGNYSFFRLIYFFGRYLAKIQVCVVIECVRDIISNIVVVANPPTNTRIDVLFLDHESRVLNHKKNKLTMYSLVASMPNTNSMRVVLSNESLYRRYVKNYRRLYDDQLILSRHFGLRNLILTIAKQLKLSWTLLKVALQKGNSGAIREFLLTAAIKQLSRQSFDAFAVALEVSKIVINTNPHTILIPYEGHPYEINLVRHIVEHHPEVKVIALQHAPIVRAQLGFFAGLRLFVGKSCLGLTGPAVKRLIEEISELTKDKLVVLGYEFDYHESGRSPIFNSDRQNAYIVAPEGSEKAMLDLIESLNKKFNKDDYAAELILRVHPHAKLSKRILDTLHESTLDFHISTRPLSEDLVKSSRCFYRSSSVAIIGLRFGLIPIYSSHFPRKLFDPLDLLLSVPSIAKVYAPLIDSFSLGWLQAKEINSLQVLAEQLGAEYFSNIEQQELYDNVVG